MDNEKDKTTQDAQEATEGEHDLIITPDGGINWDAMTPADREYFKSYEPQSDLIETAQHLAGFEKKYGALLLNALQGIAGIDSNPKWQQLKAIFPDIDKWIDTILEKRGALGAALMWLEVFAPMLAHLDDLKQHLKRIKFTGTLYDFLEEPGTQGTDSFNLYTAQQSLFYKWYIEKFGETDTVKGVLQAASPKPPEYLNLPTSNVTDLIISLLGSGGDLTGMADRKTEISHGTTYQVKTSKKGTKAEILRDSPEESILIGISTGRTTGQNKSVTKMFVLSLIKTNEQALHNGKLTRDYITFPVSELIERGIYKTKQSAYNGFYSCIDALTDIKAAARQKKKKKNNTLTDGNGGLGVLFTWGKIIDGQCYIYLNDKVHWEYIAEFFTTLPPYYFRLSKRASDLLLYIFYLARQNTDKIKRQGYFTISFKAIQARLNLPDETESNHPARDIKEPIEAAIVEIEDANSADYNNTDFTLLPVYDDTAPIADFLSKGYLQISFAGKLKESFTALQKTKEKKAAAAERKKAKQIERREK